MIKTTKNIYVYVEEFHKKPRW